MDAINLTTRLLHFAAHQFHKFLPYPAPLRCNTQPPSIFDRAFIPLHFDLPLTLFKPFDLPNFASIRSLVYCNNIRKTLQANHFEVAINPSSLVKLETIYDFPFSFIYSRLSYTSLSLSLPNILQLRYYPFYLCLFPTVFFSFSSSIF